MNVTDKTKENGRLGEDYAGRFLAAKGYEIVARNFKTRFGEIDVIAKTGEILIFAEVKTRTEGYLCAPGEAVTKPKQKRILAAANEYILANEYHGAFRFDVIEIELFHRDKFSVKRINHIENVYLEA